MSSKKIQGAQVEEVNAVDDDDDDDDGVVLDASGNEVSKDRAGMLDWTEVKGSAEDSIECEMPEGFSFEAYKPIKKKFFSHDKFYYGHRVRYHEYMVVAETERRDFAAKFGNKAQQRAIERLMKLQAKQEALFAELGMSEEEIADAKAALTAQG